MIPLRCKVQNYDWGKIGSASEVAQLASKIQSVDERKPYAELWMGTHPSGPSFVSKEGKDKLLSEWLNEHPGAMGEVVTNKWENGHNQLPFLFKVLSIAKALSIQAHPDKQLAATLHHKYKDIYKDPNHKPELAMALTNMELLCAFRPIGEIKSFLRTVPELRSVVTEEVAQRFENTADTDPAAKKAALREIFTALMNCSDEDITEAVRALVHRVQAQSLVSDEYQLVQKLNEQFPDDVGIFCVFLLNFIRLKAGEAVFLGANEPHSYISGDCAECMADSDNVVRAGLTPKLKDKETLCSMLTYSDGLPEILKGVPVDNNTMQYAAPVDEFLLERIQVDKSGYSTELPCGNVVIVYHGTGTFHAESKSFGNSELQVERGAVTFVCAHTKLNIQTDQSLTLLRCRCNVHT